jgi:thioredoxin 2
MPQAVHVVCPHCDATNRVPRERLGQGGKCGVCHRPLFEGRPLPLNDAARFDKHAQRSDIPLLVDFWASWCGPCRAMAPVFEQAAKRLEPDVRLVKVDSDAAADIAARFSIRSIPTLVAWAACLGAFFLLPWHLYAALPLTAPYRPAG